MLPAGLGLGAEAGLRSLQPQECNTRLLPWQSRHCQTGRMCEPGEDREVVGAGGTKRRGSVDTCVCVPDAWGDGRRERHSLAAMSGCTQTKHTQAHV